MEDERITLRMGTDEVQIMDSYLAGHPELGNRSLFIRTAVRERINRDADAPSAQTSVISADRDACVERPNGSAVVTIELQKRIYEAVKILVDTGAENSAAEYIRGLVKESFVTKEDEVQARRAMYAQTDPNVFPK